MAINNHIKIPAQSSIYSEIEKPRELDVYYSVPSNGVNEDTGVLMYICGFRGHAEANVFKKVRNVFADKYNLIAIQCNYFGYEFMQKSKKVILEDEYKKFFTEQELSVVIEDGAFNMEKFAELINGAPMTLYVKEDLSNETPECFAEMGIMQVMDNINALVTVLKKVRKECGEFNSKKVILFGNSHGSYLSHLFNIFAPGVVSMIIDNSSWVFPKHLSKNSRILTHKEQETRFKIVFDYNARNIIDDFQLLNLIDLYSIYENKAKIVAFHGEEDALCSVENKKRLMDKIEGSKLNLINLENLSEYEGIFTKIGHDLGANFITLFDYVMDKYKVDFEKCMELPRIKNVYIETEGNKYEVDYTGKMPVVIKKKK